MATRQERLSERERQRADAQARAAQRERQRAERDLKEQVAEEHGISEDEVIVEENDGSLEARPIPEREVEILLEEVDDETIVTEDAARVAEIIPRRTPSDMSSVSGFLDDDVQVNTTSPAEFIMGIDLDEYEEIRAWEERDEDVVQWAPSEERVEAAQQELEERKRLAEEDPEQFLSEVRESGDIETHAEAIERAGRDVELERAHASAQSDIASDLGVDYGDVEIDRDNGQFQVESLSADAEQQLQRSAADDFDADINPEAVNVSVSDGQIQTNIPTDVAREATIDQQRSAVAQDAGVDPSEVVVDRVEDGETLEFSLSEDAQEEQYLEELENFLEEEDGEGSQWDGVSIEDVESVDFDEEGQAQIQFTDEYSNEQSRIQAREEFAEELGIPESEIDVQEEDGQYVPDISRDAEEDLLVDQVVEEEGVDRDEVNVVEEDGELAVQIDEERDTRIGRALESASDWWQSGAEWAGEQVESVLPSSPVMTPDAKTGVLTPADEDIDEVVSGGAESGLSTVDPFGAALFAGDAAAQGYEELQASGEFQAEAQEDLVEMDYEDVIENPGESIATAADSQIAARYWGDRAQDAGAAAVDVGVAAGQQFREEPLETTARGVGGVGASVIAPSAAFRGAGRLRQMDFEPRGDMISRGPDRGQMDLTIQRSRNERPPSEQPADPTATTPEGRAAPREAFQSDEAYQQALRRHEERIVQETVDDAPPVVEPDATQVEQVRAMRETFDTHAEYQRELQRAREQMGREQMQQSDMNQAFGDPSSQMTSTEIADADAAGSLQIDAGFGSPGQEELASDSYLDSGLDQESPQQFADPSQETVTQELYSMDQQYGSQTVADLGVDTTTQAAFEQPTATMTAMDQPTLMDSAMDQPMQTLQQPPSRTGQRMVPRASMGGLDDYPMESDRFGENVENQMWETGIAEPDDIDIWGADDSEESDWGDSEIDGGWESDSSDWGWE